MDLQCIIFDQDGTLIDSFHAFYKAMLFACQKYDVAFTDEAYVRPKIGTHRSREILTPFVGDKLNIIHEEYYRILPTLTAERKLFPKVRSVLAKLSKEYKIAQISAKTTKTAIHYSEIFEIAQYFDSIQGSPIHSKTETIHEVLDTLSVHPEETIFVGDSIKDMRSGKEAGCKTVLCLYGYGNKNEELIQLADYQINKFSDILQIIEKITKSNI